MFFTKNVSIKHFLFRFELLGVYIVNVEQVYLVYKPFACDEDYAFFGFSLEIPALPATTFKSPFPFYFLSVFLVCFTLFSPNFSITWKLSQNSNLPGQ